MNGTLNSDYKMLISDEADACGKISQGRFSDAWRVRALEKGLCYTDICLLVKPPCITPSKGRVAQLAEQLTLNQ